MRKYFAAAPPWVSAAFQAVILATMLPIWSLTDHGTDNWWKSYAVSAGVAVVWIFPMSLWSVAARAVAPMTGHGCAGARRAPRCRTSAARSLGEVQVGAAHVC